MEGKTCLCPSPLLSLYPSHLILNYELHGCINHVPTINPTMSCMDKSTFFTKEICTLNVNLLEVK